MSFHQFLLVLRARWILALSIFLAVAGSAVAVSLLLPKQYTAIASVVVDAKTDPVAGMVYSEELLTSYLATQVDIIGSDRVVRRVVTSMQLDKMPKFQQLWRNSSDAGNDIGSWLVALLQKKLSVTPSRDSNVINIAVTWADPQFAADLANTIAKIYIDTNIELKVEPARQYASWFDERARVLRAELEARQKRLSDYQKETGIVATDEKLDIETARLSELSSQLVAIQGQRQESQSRQRQVNGNIESIPEVLQSSVIGDLKESLSQAEAREPDIASRLGKNHPDYQAIESEIATLRSRIAQESARIAASLTNTDQVNQRRENDVRAALEAQKERVLELRHQHDEVSELQNDVVTAQRDLDSVTQHRAQSSLESQMQQSNVVLLTSAVEPLKPSSPKVVVDSLLGVFLGVLLGVGTAVYLEVRRPLIRDEGELLELLGVPLLGRIGRMSYQ
jgi:chain length determinant protein EpsF